MNDRTIPSRHLLRRLLAAAACLACAACVQLLPKSQEQVAGQWQSFDEAKAAIDRIVPGKTRTAELAKSGFDPYANPNIQLLTYSDVVLRFPLGAGMVDARLDPGLRDCLLAAKVCTGYAISLRDIHHDRQGDFFMDVLGFKRVVQTHGWTFTALILLMDDRVVYTLYGGQPNVLEHEVTRRPLGPLQDASGSFTMHLAR